MRPRALTAREHRRFASPRDSIRRRRMAGPCRANLHCPTKIPPQACICSTQRYCCVVLPPYSETGNLPPGIHPAATWKEFVARFGGTPRRRALLVGLRAGLRSLQAAGCGLVYIDGVFVTSEPHPESFTAAWNIRGVDPQRLDPVLLRFDAGRVAQRAKYLGEFFPVELPDGETSLAFIHLFQTDRDTGAAKGVVALVFAGLAL